MGCRPRHKFNKVVLPGTHHTSTAASAQFASCQHLAQPHIAKALLDSYSAQPWQIKVVHPKPYLAYTLWLTFLKIGHPIILAKKLIASDASRTGRA